MGDFLVRLDGYVGDAMTKLGLRLVVLTALRTNELRGGRWNELDMAEGVWRVPSSRMKIKKRNGVAAPAHIVPLSAQAQDALLELRRLNPSTEADALMFPARSSLRESISENTLLFAMYRLGYHGRATVHGFRATFSTWANESSGAHPDAIERALAREERNQVRRAYDRSEHLIARAALMQKWADTLDTLRDQAIAEKGSKAA
jgi:integrase